MVKVLNIADIDNLVRMSEQVTADIQAYKRSLVAGNTPMANVNYSSAKEHNTRLKIALDTHKSHKEVQEAKR